MNINEGLCFVYDSAMKLVILLANGERIDEMPVEIFRREFGSAAVEQLTA
jgi:hypothetical protein